MKHKLLVLEAVLYVWYLWYSPPVLQKSPSKVVWDLQHV